jgi:RNA polymerase sigma-70 factor (ECF subfamily)
LSGPSSRRTDREDTAHDGAPPWTSVDLLHRARQGDESALASLFRRHFGWLHRWTQGRMPRWIRRFADTSDVVQDVLMHTFRRLDAFDPRGRHALRAYLRKATQNRIRDEFRRAGRAPQVEPIGPDHPDSQPSPLDVAMGAEEAARYRAALVRLKAEDRELIVGRFQMGYSYEQLALATGRVSAEATRTAVKRALVKLAAEIKHEQDRPAPRRRG